MSENYHILAIKGCLVVYQCNVKGMGEVLQSKLNLTPAVAREQVLRFVRMAKGTSENYATSLPNGLDVLFAHIGNDDYTLGMFAR